MSWAWQAWGRVGLLALTLTATLEAQVIRVPSGQPTINDALSMATSGTTILVAPGTYPETIAWPAVDGIRLIAEQGPSVTTIDAQGVAGVIRMVSPPMGVPLSRATLLQGFKITGGSPPGGIIAAGGGIAISGCSPTIRDCRIVENQCIATAAMGGGVYIDEGGAPLIERCAISRNLVTGTFLPFSAAGGGVWAGPGTRPVLLANRIRLNRVQDSTSCSGAGVFLFEADAVVAGNFIGQNTATNGAVVQGGGLIAAGAVAVIANNTLVENEVSVGTTLSGGGIALLGGATQLHNNIVVLNVGGGIDVDAVATVSLDYNDVWSNAGGDYIGLAAGSNDISVDPLLIANTAPGLQATSPCVEAGRNVHVPLELLMDVDGDPRKTDADLDGLAGNGARVDMGADEVTNVRLSTAGNVSLGSVLTFQTTGPAGWPYGTVLFFFPGGVFVDPWGVILVGAPPLVVLGVGATPGADPLTIPSQRNARGLTLYAQGIVFEPFSSKANLTNRWEGTIY